MDNIVVSKEIKHLITAQTKAVDLKEILSHVPDNASARISLYQIGYENKTTLIISWEEMI